jgi:hypothetical protein
VWAVAAGVFNIVPYFGPLIVAAALGIVGYLQFETIGMALGVSGVAMLITTLEGSGSPIADREGVGDESHRHLCRHHVLELALGCPACCWRSRC